MKSSDQPEPKPDAQAEVGRPALLPKLEPGLATTIKGQLSRAYYNGLDKKGWSLYEEKDAVDIILADLARLQPPTAGEGESV